ncbi:hypothetical protein [Kitasatospora sp. NPDC101183]|uniref:hypothetical protein n=1 Tax=Kitasatospora sp. NPDC101183 TaxID=3364100 RepID=UPI00380FB511
MTGTGQGGRSAYQEFTQGLNLHFDLGCLLALLPEAQRPAALDELVGVDPLLFQYHVDPPPVVTASAVTEGTYRVRYALARTVHSEAVQRRLLDLDDPGIDRALAGNHRRGYETERRLRLRDPATVAAAPAYRSDHHRRALLSGEPDLVAAALLDRRTALHGGQKPVRPTEWAAAWRTVRLADGPERVRRLAATLPAGAELDEATRLVVAACAEADPEPYLTSAEQRLLGAGALLARLREVRTPEERRLHRRGGSSLMEPYAPDWAVIRAAGLLGQVPKVMRGDLADHPDCPADTAWALRTGRPAPHGLPPRQPPPPPEPRPVPGPRPYHRQPLDPGPLAAPSPAAVLDVTPLGRGVTTDHLFSAVELGLLDAATAVRRARPAVSVVVCAGQTSSFHAHEQEPGGGREAVHRATLEHVATTLGSAPSPPGLWREVRSLLRPYPGPLPELFAEAARRLRR